MFARARNVNKGPDLHQTLAAAAATSNNNKRNLIEQPLPVLVVVVVVCLGRWRRANLAHVKAAKELLQVVQPRPKSIVNREGGINRSSLEQKVA